MKKYSREEYDSMLMAQHQQLYELWKKAGLIKDKKTPESSRALEARVAMLKAKTEKISDESLFPDVKKHQTEPCRYLMVRALKRGQSAQSAEKVLCEASEHHPSHDCSCFSCK